MVRAGMGWASISLAAAVALILALMLSPVLYLGYLVYASGTKALVHLWKTGLPALILRTGLLATLSTALALLLGLPLAWLVVRTDLPWRGLWRWLGVLPLAIPPYIGALTFITLFGPVGIVNKTLSGIAGGPIFDIYSLWGGVLVLGLFTYPFILLLAAAAMESTNPALEEAARSLGEGTVGIFTRVTLPLLMPSILAGSLMVFLYALADFGAVSILRLNTFTTEIYHQLNTRFEISAAAALSGVLLGLAILVLLLQGRVLGSKYYTQVGSAARPAPLIALGRWRYPGLLYAIGVISASTLLPLALLVYHVGTPGTFLSVMGAQKDYILASLWTAALAAFLVTALGFFVGYVAHRRKGLLGAVLWGTVQLSYAVPGTILGLSLILLYNTYLPAVYGTAAMVLLGYILRFLLEGLQACAASLEQVNTNLEEAARVLGKGPLGAVIRVTAPLIRPGLLTSWVLVFVSSMKELAATLLLRPAGFDTLPIRIWIATIEADYATASAVALLLIGFTALPLLLIGRGMRGIPHPSC